MKCFATCKRRPNSQPYSQCTVCFSFHFSPQETRQLGTLKTHSLFFTRAARPASSSSSSSSNKTAHKKVHRIQTNTRPCLRFSTGVCGTRTQTTCTTCTTCTSCPQRLACRLRLPPLQRSSPVHVCVIGGGGGGSVLVLRKSSSARTKNARFFSETQTPLGGCPFKCDDQATDLHLR
jgi:hypothetical protein